MDPRLQDLQDQLPNFCLNAKADSTRKKYRYEFEHFQKWCSSFEPVLCALPASDFTVSMYIVHLTETFKSVSKLHEATFAISWMHNLAGLIDPCLSSLVKQVKEGAVRETSKPVTKKDPISPQHLLLLVHNLAKENCTLYDLRTVTMCLLGFAGFLRFSEIANIKASDIAFYDRHVSIFISHSKTDRYKQGSYVDIAKTSSLTCPVTMLQRYIDCADIHVDTDVYIFRQLSYLKKSDTYILRTSNKPISYTRSREIVLAAFESIGLDKSNFGLHSLRSGGATAANAAGISGRLFKKHGRWKSEKAKDGYVRENIVEKLSVTQNLGI